MNNKEDLIKILESVIDIEHTTFVCFNYIASLLKNGRIRTRFYNLAKDAQKNKEYLINKLKEIGVTEFVLEEKCKFCRLKPESFSLLGAFNLGIEINKVAIKLYDTLLDLNKDNKEKILLKRIIKIKNNQIDFLKKEKMFSEQKEAEDIISNYCIPKIISK